MITDRTLTVLHHTLDQAQQAVDSYTDTLQASEPTMHGFIDEIALLVESEPDLRTLARVLPGEGWEQFNEARDVVRTGPIASRYEVQYTFFRHPDKPWRLEVMKIVGGVSPLHEAIRPPLGGELCVPVHASFKTADEEQYAHAVGVLQEGGFELAQRCDSTYGRFSYWINVGRVNRVPYLKPRVNLRDSAQSAIF